MILKEGFFLASDQNANKVLRLDLYRGLKDLEQGQEFRGGVLHMLKHFSRNGHPLSANKSNLDQELPSSWFLRIVEAFFLGTRTNQTNMGGDDISYEIRYVYFDGDELVFRFYYQVKCGVHFLDTIWREKSFLSSLVC